MLVIRREQMAVFEAFSLRRDLVALTQQFEVLRPEPFRAMGRAGAEAFLERAVKQALQWKIGAIRDVWALVDLMLEFGADFASAPGRPWAHGILNHPSLSGTGKIKLVTAHLRGELD